jgi:hypothetical protein
VLVALLRACAHVLQALHISIWTILLWRESQRRLSDLSKNVPQPHRRLNRLVDLSD